MSAQAKWTAFVVMFVLAITVAWRARTSCAATQCPPGSRPKFFDRPVACVCVVSP